MPAQLPTAPTPEAAAAAAATSKSFSSQQQRQRQRQRQHPQQPAARAAQGDTPRTHEHAPAGRGKARIVAGVESRRGADVMVGHQQGWDRGAHTRWRRASTHLERHKELLEGLLVLVLAVGNDHNGSVRAEVSAPLQERLVGLRQAGIAVHACSMHCFAGIRKFMHSCTHDAHASGT